ncbi:aa3-type cytochrome oxidase subunit CtaJ [Nocardia stercoris]|uniref:Uncharacterized protein n=1 Tax=Nocardia stercoris TaxID=2483361 RepID=A0A3M2L733_9NOCA|nr:hypothetical protein [Nocardia stercoris]RMI32796.1 hypothetical protein EBN03_12735 [Nocardia stercoris]
MTVLDTVLIFVGIPAAIYAVIAGLSYLGKPLPGEKPAHYTLREKWTADPVLWTATDEVIVYGHHVVGDRETHIAIEPADAVSDLIGGRASGKF